jgi:hypothetical protein
MNIPGFTAEASIYRTGGYRKGRADRAGAAFQAVEAAQSGAALIRKGVIAQRNINETITVADFQFSTPWHNCGCSTKEGWCVCTPVRQVITA